MAIENSGELIPPAKNVGGLDIIGKYRESLDVLKREHKKIADLVKEKNITNEEVLDNLKQLKAKIETMEKMIKQWDKEHPNE